MSSVKYPKCTSCNRPIAFGENVVKFNCPNCGIVQIWRCEKCRAFARFYKCVNCGFEGP